MTLPAPLTVNQVVAIYNSAETVEDLRRETAPPTHSTTTTAGA